MLSDRIDDMRSVLGIDKAKPKIRVRYASCPVVQLAELGQLVELVQCLAEFLTCSGIRQYSFSCFSRPRSVI